MQVDVEQVARPPPRERDDVLRKALGRIAREHPHIRFNEAFDFVTPVEDEYNASLMLLYEGAILAVLVVWLFLRDLRATLVSAEIGRAHV